MSIATGEDGHRCRLVIYTAAIWANILAFNASKTLYIYQYIFLIDKRKFFLFDFFLFLHFCLFILFCLYFSILQFLSPPSPSPLPLSLSSLSSTLSVLSTYPNTHKVKYVFLFICLLFVFTETLKTFYGVSRDHFRDSFKLLECFFISIWSFELYQTEGFSTMSQRNFIVLTYFLLWKHCLFLEKEKASSRKNNFPFRYCFTV